MISDRLRARIPALPVDPPGPPKAPPDSLRESFAAARAVTRTHAKSFFFASRFLPRARRDAAYAVYAYCRTVDDRIDEAPDAAHLPSRAELQEDNRLFLRGEHPAPFAPAFAWVCQHHQLPALLLDELVEGCCRDRETVRLPDFPALEEYSYLVASVVGLMMCRVFGVSSADAYPRAAEMGIAMQLTNILRDLREDFHRDRIYLPADELHGAGINLATVLRDGPSTPGWVPFLRAQIERNRQWYASAAQGLPLLRDRGGARTAAVMASVYAGILDALERHHYDPRSRHYVPLPRKCLLALRALR